MTNAEMLYQKFRASSQEPVRLELALQLKLDLFDQCLCPDTPCQGCEHHG